MGRQHQTDYAELHSLAGSKAPLSASPFAAEYSRGFHAAGRDVASKHDGQRPISALNKKHLQFCRHFVGGIGLEPTTSAMSTRRSNQLS